MIRTPIRVLASVFAFALVAVPGVASAANECEVDADCGHGFDCFNTVASVGVEGQGGAGGESMTGSGGTAGTGTAGTGTAGTSGVPVTTFRCGNGLCEGPETPRSCPRDCEDVNVCVLAECTSVSDCAEGYSCPSSSPPGTGGGPNAPFCGDAFCTDAENAQTCPADCEVVRHCTPESGFCRSDAQCADGFYCNFMGTGGVGTGGAASGGSPGTGGSANASGGAPAVGGSAGMADSGAFAPPPAGSSGTASGGAGGEAGEAADPIPSSGGTSGIIAAQGTCMPREMSGTGGATGSVGGGPATGGTGGSAEPGTAGVGTGGTTADFPPGQGGTGSSTTGAGGTTLPGSGAQGSGGSSTNATGGSGGQAATNEDDDDDGDGERIVTHGGGCSVARGAGSSDLGLLAVLALGGVLARRRSRR